MLLSNDFGFSWLVFFWLILLTSKLLFLYPRKVCIEVKNYIKLKEEMKLTKLGVKNY